MTSDLSWKASVPVLGGCLRVCLVSHSRCDAATRRWVERLERFTAGHHAVAAFCIAEGGSRYASNNWDALKRYVEQGFLAIDNNLSERTQRATALGRNNWGVIDSAVGGQTAAVLYSIVGTCKHLGIDPFAHLRDVLPGLFASGEKPAAEQLLDWLPDRWLLSRMRNQRIREVTAG